MTCSLRLRWFVAAFTLSFAFVRPSDAQFALIHNESEVAESRIPQEARKLLSDLKAKRSTIKSITFAPGGGWVVLFGRNGLFARNINDEAFQKLRSIAQAGSELTSISSTADGGWVILFDKTGLYARNIPDEAFKKLVDLQKQGKSLKGVSFTSDGGWLILYERNGFDAHGIPDEATKKLQELAKQNAELHCVSFAPGGGWGILFDANGFAEHKLSENASAALRKLAAAKTTKFQSLSFLPAPSFQLSKDDAATRAAVEARLAHFKVPGISIALIEDGKIAWARGYGVVRAGGKPVTDRTRFQAASISKPVAAVMALRLVADGKLNLDAPLNDKLKSWKVPASSFTETKQPTLRQLLSHSAGFTVHGFAGYRTDQPIPSLIEILNGTRPANSGVVRIFFEPGSRYQYAGGGYCVLQQMLIDVTETQFPTLAENLVLRPIGLNDSSYEQPRASDVAESAATAHAANGTPIGGEWHIYPEMAAAGLWTTPTDLAKFALAIMDARKGKPNAILPKDVINAMLTPQKSGFGLGLMLSGEEESFAFIHGGSNAGFRCHLVGFPNAGKGAVLMTNSDNGDRLIAELAESLISEYEWPR